MHTVVKKKKKTISLKEIQLHMQYNNVFHNHSPPQRLDAVWQQHTSQEYGPEEHRRM